jgi:hypothetical protein
MRLPKLPIPFFDGGRWSVRDIADVIRGGTAEIEDGELPERRLCLYAERINVDVVDYRGWDRTIKYGSEYGYFRDKTDFDRDGDTREWGRFPPFRGRAYGVRPWKKTTAVMLHTADVVMPRRRFIGVPAHCGVASDGSIVLMHPINALVAHGNSANSFSVGVEISGRSGAMTDLQRKSGRLLLEYVRDEILRHRAGNLAVMAHRQSDGKNRARDPGPKIWRELGEWSKRELGFVEGPTLRKGQPIPGAWR